MRYLRILYKTPLFILLGVLSYVVLAGCDALKFDHARKSRNIDWLYDSCMWLLGIKCRYVGELAPGPALVVANHCSHIDVLMLSSLGEMFFTPKSEVKTWPFIGPLISRFNVIYVDRTPARTKEIQQNLFAKLASGGRICVFPEATTSDGRGLLPFKSSLFSLAEQWPGQEPLPIQPVTVVYKRVNGQPINDATWPKVAWYGEIDIVRHLLSMFTLRRIEAEVIVHPPIALQPGETRKQLCARAQTSVASVYPYGDK